MIFDRHIEKNSVANPDAASMSDSHEPELSLQQRATLANKKEALGHSMMRMMGQSKLSSMLLLTTSSSRGLGKVLCGWLGGLEGHSLGLVPEALKQGRAEVPLSE
jgi:hypothetical protein